MRGFLCSFAKKNLNKLQKERRRSLPSILAGTQVEGLPNLVRSSHCSIAEEVLKTSESHSFTEYAKSYAEDTFKNRYIGFYNIPYLQSVLWLPKNCCTMVDHDDPKILANGIAILLKYLYSQDLCLLFLFLFHFHLWLSSTMVSQWEKRKIREKK